MSATTASGTGRRLDGRPPGFGSNTEESLVWYVSMGCGLQSGRHTLLLWRRSCITGLRRGSRLFNVPVPVPVMCQWWFVTARLRRHRVYDSGWWMRRHQRSSSAIRWTAPVMVAAPRQQLTVRQRGLQAPAWTTCSLTAAARFRRSARVRRSASVNFTLDKTAGSISTTARLPAPSTMRRSCSARQVAAARWLACFSPLLAR